MVLVLLQNAWSGWYLRLGRPGEEIKSMRERVWDRSERCDIYDLTIL